MRNCSWTGLELHTLDAPAMLREMVEWTTGTGVYKERRLEVVEVVLGKVREVLFVKVRF